MFNFINQVITTTILLAIILLLGFWADNQLSFGLGILCGATWGSVNILLIKHLLEKQLCSSTKKSWKYHFLLGVKFPMLYCIGYILLNLDVLPVFALVSGFSLLLATTLGVGLIFSLMNVIPKNADTKPLADNCHGK